MKAYVLSIAGIVLVIAAVTIISPSGKMGKFIKGAGRLFILAVMVAPFATFFGEKKRHLLSYGRNQYGRELSSALRPNTQRKRRRRNRANSL